MVGTKIDRDALGRTTAPGPQEEVASGERRLKEETMRGAAGLLGALVLAVASAATAAAAGTAAAPNVEATHDSAASRTNVSPVLLRDHLDPNTLYMAEAEMQRAQCRFYVSHDAGRTWTQGATPNLSPYSCTPGSIHPAQYSLSLAQASNGTILYALQANAEDGTHSVFLARSNDGGSSWRVSPVDVVPTAAQATGPVVMDIGPRVAVDPGNPSNVYVTWRRTDGRVAGHPKGPYARPWLAASTDGGATFSAPVLISQSDVGDFGPAVLVNGGSVYAFFPANPEGSSSTPALVLAAVSSDHGRTWTQRTISSAPSADPMSAVYDTQRQQFDVAWDDNRLGNLDIWYSHSSDGTNWSSPRRLNSDPPSDRRGHYFPQLALTPDGRLVAAWYDFRNDPSPAPTPSKGATAFDEGSDLGQWEDVYAAWSTDGGVTWSPDVRVTDLSIDRTKGTWNGQYFFLAPPALTANQTGAVAAWSDTRLGNAATSSQDIFTGDVTFSPAGSDITSPIPLWLWLLIGAATGLTLGAGAALLVASRVMRRRVRSATPEHAPRQTVTS